MDDIELFECPLCGGTGLLEEENGWIRLTARGLDVANQVFADFLLSV